MRDFYSNRLFTIYLMVPALVVGILGWLAYFLFMFFYIGLWYFFSEKIGSKPHNNRFSKKFLAVNILNLILGGAIFSFPEMRLPLTFTWLFFVLALIVLVYPNEKENLFASNKASPDK